MNWSFEETHIDVAQRIAKAASENDMLERYWHVSCLGAKEDATSRRLRTKVVTGGAHGSSWSVWRPGASLACRSFVMGPLQHGLFIAAFTPSCAGCMRVVS